MYYSLMAVQCTTSTMYSTTHNILIIPFNKGIIIDQVLERVDGTERKRPLPACSSLKPSQPTPLKENPRFVSFLFRLFSSAIFYNIRTYTCNRPSMHQSKTMFYINSPSEFHCSLISSPLTD